VKEKERDLDLHGVGRGDIGPEQFGGVRIVNTWVGRQAIDHTKNGRREFLA
jgi:hypothetical protein